MEFFYVFVSYIFHIGNFLFNHSDTIISWGLLYLSVSSKLELVRSVRQPTEFVRNWELGISSTHLVCSTLPTQLRYTTIHLESTQCRLVTMGSSNTCTLVNCCWINEWSINWKTVKSRLPLLTLARNPCLGTWQVIWLIMQRELLSVHSGTNLNGSLEWIF